MAGPAAPLPDPTYQALQGPGGAGGQAPAPRWIARPRRDTGTLDKGQRVGKAK